MPIDIDVDIAVAIPVNVLPLLDDGDFKTRETSVAYNAAGMDLVWNFVTTGGVMTQTAVTPTTAGDYDWSHVGDGMYKIEIPASGGASINNNSEGAGWFSGVATGVLPWVSPVYRFRAAGLNDLLIDSAYSTTRGLAGTALPNAAAEASGGLATLSAAQASNGTVPANVHRWLTGTPNALISGRVDSNPGALQASVITATSIATGAITSAKFAAGAIDAAAIANSAIDAATFAADVDAEFLSYIVDDATRIDASALNTLSSHDPGETIMGATDLGTGSGLTSLATAAELAKVPKSDGTATWNATALASIQSEANDAIVANRLDELLAADSDIDGAAPPTVGSVFHELLSKTAGSFTFDQTTDSLEALRDRGDAAWTTATGFSTHSASDVWAVATRTITTLDEDSTTIDLDAAIRAAVGLASANMDTQLADLPTVAEFDARTLVAASYATAAAQTTAQNDLDILTGADGVTLATSQPNYAPATAAALASLVTTVGAAGAGLTEAGGTGDQLTAIPWNASWDAEVQSEVTDALNAALTEAYRSTGATGSVAQLLYEIIAHLGNSAIASTTKTTKRLDKTTTAKTYTLDDDTTPTAIEEAT